MGAKIPMVAKRIDGPEGLWAVVRTDGEHVWTIPKNFGKVYGYKDDEQAARAAADCCTAGNLSNKGRHWLESWAVGGTMRAQHAHIVEVYAEIAAEGLSDVSIRALSALSADKTVKPNNDGKNLIRSVVRTWNECAAFVTDAALVGKIGLYALPEPDGAGGGGAGAAAATLAQDDKRKAALAKFAPKPQDKPQDKPQGKGKADGK